MKFEHQMKKVMHKKGITQNILFRYIDFFYFGILIASSDCKHFWFHVSLTVMHKVGTPHYLTRN